MMKPAALASDTRDAMVILKREAFGLGIGTSAWSRQEIMRNAQGTYVGLNSARKNTVAICVFGSICGCFLGIQSQSSAL